MKKIILFLVAILAIVASCSDDNSEPTGNLENVVNLKSTLKEDYEPYNLVYTVEYTFDKQGRVISENFYNSQQYSYFNTFEYNEKGQVTKEIRDGKVHRYILWTNDFAEVFNNQDQKLSEFNFVGDKLTKYKIHLNTENATTNILNYDSNQNIVSIENETGIFVEFLDYETTKRNPFNLIKSIGILRIYSRSFFKNIFGVEKAYPYQGDDYSVSLRFYDYYYEFDSENRVVQIKDDKSAIYTEEFSYEE